jgi:hypothetical protein
MLDQFLGRNFLLPWAPWGWPHTGNLRMRPDVKLVLCMTCFRAEAQHAQHERFEAIHTALVADNAVGEPIQSEEPISTPGTCSAE